MKFDIRTTSKDVGLVRAAIKDQAQSKLVLDRRQRNLSKNKSPVDEARFWKALVCMRLSSRQKSGPGSAVSRLRTKKPFPLALTAVRDQSDGLEKFIRSVLMNVGGLRDYNTAAAQLAANFTRLEYGGLWKPTLQICNALTKSAGVTTERRAARFLAESFAGIGPKQSRNILQALGLTRYEIPLDSRVIRWLREQLGCSPLSAQLLQDAEFYEFVLDTIQEICEKAGEFPCILDAAIFASGDPDTWTSEEMTY